MQINSVNSLNFKGYKTDNDCVCEVCTEENESNVIVDDAQVDEFNKADDYNKAIGLTEELEDKFVNTKDIKKPGAVALSVGAAGGKTFLKTVATVFALDKVTNNKFSNLFEQGMKKVAKATEFVSGKMIKSEGKKLSKVANVLGGFVQKAEGSLKSVYKKIATTTKDGIKTHSASKGLAVLAGIASVFAFVPAICKRDNNGDGVADLVQKSQSAYDKTNSKCSKLLDGANCVSEIAQLVS